MSGRKSWHQGPQDTDYEYQIFQLYLMLPHQKPARRRTIKGAYESYCEEQGITQATAPGKLHKARRDKAWDERARNYDAHIRTLMQEGQDRGIVGGAAKQAQKSAEKAAEALAFNITRMRGEVADFVDEAGPEIRGRILDLLRDPDSQISAASLAQLQRVVLDSVKLLDRGESGDDDETMTDEELQAFLDQGSTTEGS